MDGGIKGYEEGIGRCRMVGMKTCFNYFLMKINDFFMILL